MARSDIYGIDDNAFAQRIASDSLDTSKGGEDYMGETPSKGNKPLDPSKISTKRVSTDGDKPGDSEGN